jgi:hypothetical protein
MGSPRSTQRWGFQPAARFGSLSLVMLKLVRALAAHPVKIIAEAVLLPGVSAGGAITQSVLSPSRPGSFTPPLEQTCHPLMMPEGKTSAHAAGSENADVPN